MKLIHFQDPLFGIGSDILPPRKIASALAENMELRAQCFSTMQTPSENFLISCGNWENSFQVISLSDGRVVQSIRQHKDVVSCVAGINHYLVHLFPLFFFFYASFSCLGSIKE